MTTITMSNGDVFAVSDDFPGIERVPSVCQERHFFNHSFMRQPESAYPVDRDIRCVGEVVEEEL
jgi:hypothetical protein